VHSEILVFLFDNVGKSLIYIWVTMHTVSDTMLHAYKKWIW